MARFNDLINTKINNFFESEYRFVLHFDEERN